MKKTLIAIIGPTAVGKTDVAIAIAKAFGTEIISADSRQFYKELNIGVARPSEEQLRAIKHHFIACRSVKEEYTAGEFEKDALQCLRKIFKRHDVALIAGGSGLYVKAVCEGLDAAPKGDETIRTHLENEWKEKGLRHLQNELKTADPEYYRTADIKNPRRVLRALEVFRASGNPFSSFHTSRKKKRDFQIIKIGLTMERDLLYARINQRVDEMMQKGLLDEARKLYPLKHINALQTVGYQELFGYLEGKTDLETAVSLIRQNTRNYARRQLTWYRKDKEVKWFEPEQSGEIMEYLRAELKC